MRNKQGSTSQPFVNILKVSICAEDILMKRDNRRKDRQIRPICVVAITEIK